MLSPYPVRTGGGRGRGTCVTPVGESNREGVMDWLWEKSRLRPGVSDSITFATPRGELNRAVVWGWDRYETFATPGGESNRGGAVNWLLDESDQRVPTSPEKASHSEGNRVGISPHGGSRRARKTRDAQGTEGGHVVECNDDITVAGRYAACRQKCHTCDTEGTERGNGVHGNDNNRGVASLQCGRDATHAIL